MIVRFNSHQKDSKKKDAILLCKHFENSNHIFQGDAKSILTEEITKIYDIIEEVRFILEK